MVDGIHLHTASRKFCISQHAEWMQKYMPLQLAAVNDVKSRRTYSQEKCRIFPRYRLAEATLINLERFVPDAETSVSTSLQIAQEAGEVAYSELSAELAPLENGHVVLDALREQLDSYLSFLVEVMQQPNEQIEPLPYRRVLSTAESIELWQTLSDQWQIRGPGYGWFPLSDDPAPEGVLTFHEELWDARDGEERLRDFLAEEHTERCFLLRELGPPNYELDAALVDVTYDGSEKFLFAARDWLLYSSHESSLTLTGRLAAFIRDVWLDADQLSYGGPFHTADLRGTWSMS
jgi:hypothetical protein